MVSYMVEQLEHAQQRRDASLNVEKVAENSNTPNQWKWPMDLLEEKESTCDSWVQQRFKKRNKTTSMRCPNVHGDMGGRLADYHHVLILS